MRESSFQLDASDGHYVHCCLWEPEPQQEKEPVAIVQIAHGMGEHIKRYRYLAEKLTQAGYVVVANDHRGHGKTAIMLGDFGKNGWRRMVVDLSEVNQEIRKKYPKLPLILLGHSMGALLSQQYIVTYPGTIEGIVLSGSPGFAEKSQLLLAFAIATFERWRHGPLSISSVLKEMIFGRSNKQFENETDNPTGFEWLSRDAAEVKKYMDDDYCGFVPCTRSICEMMQGRRHMQKPRNLARLNKDIPYYIFSGEDDPVHGRLEGINHMLKEYRNHGCLIETRFYPQGRHEMFNEINKDEVIADLIDWLDRYFAPGTPEAPGTS